MIYMKKETIKKDVLKKEIGERVKSLRGKMTQAEFGKIFGRSQDAICAYEKGIVFPPIDVIVKMAQQFNVSVEWIITGKESPAKGGKEGFTFKNFFVREGEPEWRLMEIVTKLPRNTKEEIVEVVETYLKVRKKK